MLEDPTHAQYETMLRQDFSTFAARCFYDLNPQTNLAVNWHIEVIAAKLAAVRQGKIRRLIINLPPRFLKSLMASIAFPACLLCWRGYISPSERAARCSGSARRKTTPIPIA